MEIIKSRQNKIIKLAHKLAGSSKARKKEKMIIFDGISFGKDYLKSGFNYQYILVSQDVFNQESQFLMQFEKVVVIENDLIDYISPVKTSSGMIIIANQPKQNTEINTKDSMIILENIQDSGNLGTIIRSCLAFGINQIILSKESVDPYSPESIRASASACFGLKIYKNIDLINFISENNLNYVVTTPHTDNNLKQFEIQNPVFIFGNEGRGVSEEIMKLVKNKVKIQQSDKIESLNLASSVAICLHQYYNK